MKKHILLLALLTTILSFGQQGLYQTIEANGEGAEYQKFGGKDDLGNGNYLMGFSKGFVTIKIRRLPSGTPIGIEATNVETGKKEFNLSELSDYSRVDSYPHAINIKHTYTKKGYVIIDDILFEFTKIRDNGILQMKDVWSFYVLKKDRNTSKGKKKKKKGFFSKMKSKMVGLKPEHEYVKGLNLDKMLSDYVTNMKAKQTSYKLTTKDRKEIAEIKRTREKGDEEIKRYNDSVIATPEHQRMLKHRREMDAMKKESGGSKVTIKNNSRSQVIICYSSGPVAGKINAGSSTKFNCTDDLYIGYKSGSSYKRSNTKVYSKNSNCGGTVNVN